MSAFTKGPWRYCGADRAGGCCCGQVWSLPADFHVATAHRSHGDSAITREEMLANAALISAAPCLLSAGEALDAVLKRVKRLMIDAVTSHDRSNTSFIPLATCLDSQEVKDAQQAWKAAKDKATGKESS